MSSGSGVAEDGGREMVTEERRNVFADDFSDGNANLILRSWGRVYLGMYFRAESTAFFRVFSNVVYIDIC